MVQMNWSAGQKLRHRYREKTYGHQEGKVVGGVGGGMNWEIGINMYILICIKWITIRTCWASLVAQWLRVCLLMQGTRVRALVWEDPACRGAARPVSHSY